MTPVSDISRAADPSLPDAFASVRVGRGSLWRRILGFAGPGFLIAVGYMDPGNWATDIAAARATGTRCSMPRR